MSLSRTFKQASIPFFAGVLIVAIGAAGVMFFKPVKAISPEGSARPVGMVVKGEDAGGSKADVSSSPSVNYGLVSVFIALTALCWGAYGPVLHKGQMKMGGSRLRPLLCVGIAYFAVAVVTPLLLMPVFPEPGGWPIGGTLWSLGGGAAGAFGAIGIIYAFNFGGKPIFVMPLVFGCAPVVNTFVSTISAGTYASITTPFVLSLIMVVAGAISVLVFAPSSPHKPEPKAKS